MYVLVDTGCCFRFKVVSGSITTRQESGLSSEPPIFHFGSVGALLPQPSGTLWFVVILLPITRAPPNDIFVGLPRQLHQDVCEYQGT
mmetsp:Transcript_3432/g.7668  ORF Transcript_3432/g.7668 Transcript_3432/m.7668 type:complete len:87 (-) Transcript_3432:115-375(-)